MSPAAARRALVLAAVLVAAGAAVRWASGPSGAGDGKVRLVVFGPSSWDTFAPGAPPAAVKAVTDALDRRFLQAHPEVGAIVSECANLLRYAAPIRERTGRPVFDLRTLVMWQLAGLQPAAFDG